MLRRFAASLVVAAAGSVSLGLCLELTQVVPVGAHPRHIVSTDLNGDGAVDLVITERDADRLSILKGNHEGHFAAPYTVGVGVKPEATAAADLDRDGDVDLAVANGKSNTISVLMNDGTGLFPTMTTYAVKKNPLWIGAGDLNGDAWPDLVVICSVDSKMVLLMGTGAGAFAAPIDRNTGTNPSSGALRDLDGDGALDVVVVSFATDSVAVHYGDGSGGFEQIDTYGAGDEPEDVSVLDLDRDGQLDLAIAAVRDNAIVVLWGNGPRLFSPPTSSNHFFTTGGEPQSLVTLDIDGDCEPDAVAASPETGEVHYLPGDGQGGFGAPQVILNANRPQRLVVNDFNRDLRPDLAVVDRAANNVTILMGENPACGVFALRRSTDPATVASSQPYRLIGLGPFDDDEGTLSDGSFYYYTLEHVGGLAAPLSVHPNKVLDAVRIGFNDGDPLSAHPDDQLSKVTAVVEELETGGVAAMVTVVPRDLNGTGVGLGCDISIDTNALYPGTLDGPVQDLGNGIYEFRVLLPAPGGALVKVTVEGMTLADQPLIAY